MPVSELNVLFSCHSLDDFPTYHTGDEAEGILAAYTALWHPALIAAAGKLPAWIQASNPPEQLAGRLIAVPQVVQDDMPGFFFSQAEQDGSRLVTGIHDREHIVNAALDALRADSEHEQPEHCETIDLALAADFLALGFCYLQTELLTRRMRYMSSLDEAAFERSTVAAARAAVGGNAEETRVQLSAAFNALFESRGYFYPVDAYFLDLTLIAPTTIGAALRQELAADAPMNVLLSVATLEKMAWEEPATLSMLKAGLEAGTVGLIGGVSDETELPLLPREEILRELQSAGEIYRRLLGRKPKVFGRWQSGLTPVLPQILHQCGFSGAMHFTLDGAGRFPQADRIKSAWVGLDGTSINAITKPPLDAGRPETFLALSDAMGDTMDHDFVATALFAHWPGRASPFYGDLRRAAHYAAVLGKFTTVEKYFADTESATKSAEFTPDDYRCSYLQRSIADNAVDTIAAIASVWKQDAQRQSAETIGTMASVLQYTPCLPNKDEAQGDGPLRNAVEAFAAALRGPTTIGQTSTPGYLVVNSLNCTRRVGIELPKLSLPPNVGGPVLAADDSTGTKRAVIEVPPLGFAWIAGGSPRQEVAKSRRGKPSTIAVDEKTLQNEFCAVKIHPQTGGIQSIHNFRRRGNLLSQQLAIRLPSPQPSWLPSEPNYTIMAVDSIEVEQNDSTLGRIASRGRLVDPSGKVLAQFRQVVGLWHSAKSIELEVELISLFAELTSDAWNSYFASRFAWSSSTARLRRSLHGCSAATNLCRIEAPQFVEIVDGDRRTAILCGGLPFHLRSSDRMLDTILKVRGERAMKFRLAIGIDVPHAWRAAQEMLVPPMAVFQSGRDTPAATSGWLFHMDAPNVMATHWSPFIETTPHPANADAAGNSTKADQIPPAIARSTTTAVSPSVKRPFEAGRVAGFRVRLLECEARRGPVRVRCFRQPTSAERFDLDGTPRGKLAIDGDAVICEIGPYEWIQMEARW
ncbi:MAG: hypothetical protein IT427_18350 [Pirellulales bacterium]|nr:hypothetical protein [Pirellulales bacterium]